MQIFSCRSFSSRFSCPFIISTLQLKNTVLVSIWFFQGDAVLWFVIYWVAMVEEKSGNSVFRFIVHKFSSRLWNAFSLGKNEKYAAKQAKRSIWHSIPDLCSSCGQWFSVWMNSFSLFPREAEKGWKLREKCSWPIKKTKANVNIDCFSLIKGQWKLFKVQWKVREFLTFWWVATLNHLLYLRASENLGNFYWDVLPSSTIQFFLFL